MRPRGARPVLLTISAFLALAGAAAWPARAADLVESPTGLRTRIHGPDEIARSLLLRNGRLFLLHPGVGELELLTGPQDPRSRRPCEAFHPHDSGQVRATVLEFTGIRPRVELDVFVLPAPPVEVQGSFSRGRAVFLSPGYLPVAPATTAYASAHELGHALAAAYLDPLPRRWREYEALRGLSADLNGPAAPHAARSREILAEDLRHLFGGPTAAASGTIENGGLPLPEQVPGLRELLAGYLQGEPPGRTAACAAFPNPCNPAATVRLELPPEAGAGPGELTVWDCRGRLLRTITGGLARPGEILFVWDGRDAAGRPCAGGRYLCRIRSGGVEGSASVTLLR